MENNFTAELGIYQRDLDARLKKIQNQDFVHRLWNKDESLWETYGHSLSLGWLGVAGKMMKRLPEIGKFCHEIKKSGINQVVLLGMGGSAMAPMVFQKMEGIANGFDFFIIDNPEPRTIKRIESKINFSKTLFIVSSKMGNTLEVITLFEYFYYKVSVMKNGNPGENFIAITDEESTLFTLAEKNKFRKIFVNFPAIGGRFSGLSYVGIVPAFLMGINVKEILRRTQLMEKKCGPLVPVSENPGIFLGVILAVLAERNCNKLTYLVPPELSNFGLWLEQLLAESTGKNRRGILPLNGQPLSQPDTYGKDRFFLKMNFPGDNNINNAEALHKLIQRQFNPVINITIKESLDIGAEFFRWQIAAVTAGALLRVNPFDQPNVRESKTYTEALLKKTEVGKFPEMEPALKEGSLIYYSIEKIENQKLLVEKFFSTTQPGDYIGLLAFLPAEQEVISKLSGIENLLQENLHLPVTTQFGPRYLHSTGQFFKGGAKNGYFVQFVCRAIEDIPIPGRPYTFGELLRAQAIGDMEALLKHERKVIIVDLGLDYIAGLDSIKNVIEKLTRETLVI